MNNNPTDLFKLESHKESKTLELSITIEQSPKYTDSIYSGKIEKHFKKIINSDNSLSKVVLFLHYLPNLSIEYSLSGLLADTLESFIKIPTKYPNIVELAITCPINPPVLVNQLLQESNCDKITFLDLRSSALCETTFNFFCKTLSRYSNLLHLNLSDSKLRDLSIDLAKALSNNNKLSELILQKNYIPANTIKILICDYFFAKTILVDLSENYMLLKRQAQELTAIFDSKPLNCTARIDVIGSGTMDISSTNEYTSILPMGTHISEDIDFLTLE